MRSTIVRLTGALTIAAFVSLPALATPPQPPVRLQLDEAAVVMLKRDAVPLRLIVTDQEITDVTVTASLKTLEEDKADFEQPSARRVYQQRIEGDFQRELEIPIRGDFKQEALLDIRVVGKFKSGGGFSDRAVRYLRRNAEGAIELITAQERQKRIDGARQQMFDELRRKDPRVHPIEVLFGKTTKVPADAKRSEKPFGNLPPERRIEVRPAELTPFLKEHSVDKTQTSYTSRDPITVRGRFVFQDIDGVWKPAVNIAIHLWDSDTFGDEHLGSVATDWDGRWSFTVNNDDGWLQDGRDLYYTAKLDTTRLSLGTCNLFSGAYEWKSATHDDMNDGVVLDFGEETGSTDMGALQTFSSLNLAWNHAVTSGGFDPGKIDGCFPGSGTFFDGKINVAAGDVDGPDSITHEYGHGVMDRAYSGGDPSPGGNHGFGDCGQNRALSWSEGFATGFMLTLRQDGTYNWHQGDMGQPIELFQSSCHTGESNEGWVAASLLDMFDRNNDTNGGNEDFGRNGASDSNQTNTVALATMLRDTMVGTQHSDVSSFWSDLAGNLSSAQRPPAQTVMNYDWMPVLLPGSCVATKVATQELANPDSILDGLRKFRDHGLKPWPTGRKLANSYYRNSPEIALALLKNPALVEDSLTVMRYFAAVGETLTQHKRYSELARADAPIISQEVAQSAERLLKALDEKASEELKRDIVMVKRELNAAQSMTFSDLQRRGESEKQNLNDAGKCLAPMKTQDLTPGSRKAIEDERIQNLIRKSFSPAQSK